MLRFWAQAGRGSEETPSVPSEPFECDLEQAQDWCNFVVLRPDWLPPDCRLDATTVRPETPQRPSSLRMIVQGRGRSFRLKQFYLDWWVPTSCDTNLTGPGRAFVAAGIVGYFGRDYKGREAACTHRYGAVLELSVTEGTFTEREIGPFLENLQPQVPEAVKQVAALPFAQLSYYARRGPGPGLFNTDLLSACRWGTDLAVLEQEFPPARVYYPEWLPEGFGFDSVGTRHEPASHHWEYQLLFRDRDNLTDNIWLRAVGEETERVLWISPGLDRRMGVRLAPKQLARRTVRVGSVCEPYGERVAQWIENGVALEVHARASLHVGAGDFLSFLDSLRPKMSP